MKIMLSKIMLTKQKYIGVEVCNQESLENFRREIVHAEIYEKLQRELSTAPNVNYEILSNLFEMAKTTHIPRRTKNVISVSTEKKFG